MKMDIVSHNPPLSLLCTPILEKNMEDMEKAINRAQKLDVDIIELRLDVLTNPDPEKIIKLLENIKVQSILTNRMKSEGGFFNGSEENRIGILIDLADESDFVDIELRTDSKYMNKVVNKARSSIISYHNFHKTPSLSVLKSQAQEAKRWGDMAKIAVMPQTMSDTLIILQLVSEVPDTIGISMGNLGKYTRIVAPLLGSPITYAYAVTEAAPGQMDVSTTRDLLAKLTVER